MSPQHDFVIDNGTGSAVRADLNNLFKAILTNNSGTTDPSTVISSDAGSKAFSFWADTNSSPAVLKIRNAADDGWIELFQLDGTITLEDGSASTPALANRGDLNTGVFFSAADTFNIATGGVERLELASTGTVFNEDGADVDFRIEGDTEANLFYVNAGTNRIGIGTNAPATALDLRGDMTITSAAPFISFVDSDHDDDFNIQVSAGIFAINSTTDSANRLTINSSGNVGLGLSSANNLLHLSGTDPVIQLTDTAGGDDHGIFVSHSGYFGFYNFTDSRVDMAIDGAGKVGIGTTSVNQALHLARASGDTIFEMQRTDTNTTGGIGTISFTASDGHSVGSIGMVGDGDNEGGDMIIRTTSAAASNDPFNAATAETMKIASTGLVSVLRNGLNLENATASDSRVFRITNASGSTGWTFGNGVIADAHQFAIYDNTAGASRLLINSNGQVGLGTTSPSSTLDVVSANALTTEFKSTNSGGGYIQFDLAANGATLGYIGRSGQLVSSAGTADNLALRSQTEIEFAIGVSNRAKITANGIETGNTINVSTAANLVNPITVDDAINNNFSTNALNFQKGSTGSVGSISCTRTATSYNTSSDYRLKENAVAISDGITRLKTLIPRRFNWISDDTNTPVDGFFAHEVTAVPEAITGTKDEVATEDIDGKNIKKGDPIYQQIDQAKLVPLIVAAVQELITKVETLEAA